MKSIRIIRLILAIGFTGICPGLRAQALPDSVVNILKANPEVWLFPREKRTGPVWEAHDSEAGYLKKWEAFIASQRYVNKQITAGQRQRLISILLDPKNYGGSHSILDDVNIGIVFKSGDSLVTLFCGFMTIRAYGQGIEQTVWLNGEGANAYELWLNEYKARDIRLELHPPGGQFMLPAPDAHGK